MGQNRPKRQRNKPTFLFLPSIRQAILFLFISTPPVLALFPPRPLFISYALAINIATFFLYYHDKAQSRISGWRVTEQRLHLCELLGGWPAAFIAQRLFRHKIRKTRYQMEYWAIVLSYEAVLVDRLTGGALRRITRR